MNFDPSPKQQEFLDAVRRVTAEYIAPRAASWDEASTVPHEGAQALGALGAYGVRVPREGGGLGLDAVSLALAVEEVASECPALGLQLATQNALFCHPLARFGSEAQRQAFLSPVASGRASGALALAEADAGDDLAGLATCAVPAGDGFRLEGEKAMVRNGGFADFLLTIAVVEGAPGRGGPTGFVFPADLPGVRRGERAPTLGLRSADVRSLRFEAVRLGPEHRLGEAGGGLPVASAALEMGRIGVAALAVGIARGAWRRGLARARGERRGGRFLHEIPAVQELLANMVVELDAARLATLWAAQLADAGDPALAAAAARAQLTASEMCGRVTEAALELHGGRGYLTEAGVERFHRDAEATRLLEGTPDGLRQVLSAWLAGD
jgi:butyryl-CoA dehydrogenase